ncbi:TPA: TIGR03750 family conjugal transfer protein [Escherichia coli]|nr:TIGR03750 family conjugal transfer protein [Escherichia coli]HCP1510460.1 TIGR03750 family conjugal transfer protein [Escherichia coli]HCP1667544.1 TIGR03750 family conjugal transfer protein [Escherichia coli]HCP1808811.1 TIGR03750 family conjugal transfer protein [Escherichia coli]
MRSFPASSRRAGRLTGAGLGLLWPLPLLPLTGWVIIPTGMMVTPLLLVWFGGSWITRMKRGKPNNWLWQRLEEKKCRAGMGRSSLIMETQGWSLRRSRSVRRVL